MLRRGLSLGLVAILILAAAGAARAEESEGGQEPPQFGFGSPGYGFGPLRANFDALTQLVNEKRAGVLTFDTTIPTSGLLDKYFHPGYGGTLGGRVPFRPFSNPSGGVLWQPVLMAGFTYTYFDGRSNEQINTPANNFRVSNGDVYLGELGLGVERFRNGVFGATFIGAGVNGRLGGLFTDLTPVAFNPADPVTTLNADANRDGLLGGYRVNVWAGVVLNNGWRLQGQVGFGHDWTDALTNRTRSSGSVSVGGGIVIPFAGRLFRNDTIDRPARELLIFLRPRVRES